MEPLSEIKEIIRRIAGKQHQMVFTAKVVDVDGETCTVELEETLKLTDVRLRAVINGENSKILVTPKTNSYVLVADLAGDLSQLAVIGYSEVEKIEVDADNKIIFNGGDNEGLVKIKKLTEKLNNIEKDVNSLKQTLSLWTPVAQDGGLALKAALSTWMANELHITEQNEMEDDKITH